MNIIKIKHGKTAPSDGVLKEYELGYGEEENQLYIGLSKENNESNEKGKTFSKVLGRIYTGNIEPDNKSNDYKLWINSIPLEEKTIEANITGSSTCQIDITSITKNNNGCFIYADFPEYGGILFFLWIDGEIFSHYYDPEDNVTINGGSSTTNYWEISYFVYENRSVILHYYTW